MSKKNQRIYLDYAAATPVDSSVRDAMLPYFSDRFANPGSIHQEGIEARHAVAESRTKIARFLGARPETILFTSGGTESNNLAIAGLRRACEREGRKPHECHFITSHIEHPSILEAFADLERRGYRVDYLGVDSVGRIDVHELAKLLLLHTVLVSLSLANNEIGTLEPITEAARVVRRFKKAHALPLYPLLHTDAGQALLYSGDTLSGLGVDLLTLDAQKMYGPKGVGALYIKPHITLVPAAVGGGQERGLRAGTENVPGIVGFARACELAVAKRIGEAERISKLRDYARMRLLREIPALEYNGSQTQCLPNIVNISLPGMSSELAVIGLDARGIAVGARSACASSKEGISYVLKALGKTDALAASSVRISMGTSTTKESIDRLIDALKEIRNVEGSTV